MSNNNDFSDLIARTLTVNHWTSHLKGSKFDTNMVKQLYELNLSKFELDQGELVNTEVKDLFRTTCLKVLFAIIMAYEKDDVLLQIFEQTITSYLTNFQRIPIMVIKAALLFLTLDEKVYFETLLSLCDHTQVDLS